MIHVVAHTWQSNVHSAVQNLSSILQSLKGMASSIHTLNQELKKIFKKILWPSIVKHSQLLSACATIPRRSSKLHPAGQAILILLAVWLKIGPCFLLPVSFHYFG